jgi:hypothetical protein
MKCCEQAGGTTVSGTAWLQKTGGEAAVTRDIGDALISSCVVGTCPKRLT